MKLTEHARVRMRQRGFSDSLVNIVTEQGRLEKAPGCASKVFFGKREHQRFMKEIKALTQLVDKARNCSLIIGDDNVLTVYK